MRKHTPKLNVNLSGKMNENDAGYVGKVIALAAMLAAFAPVIWATGRALSEVITAIRWW